MNKIQPYGIMAIALVLFLAAPASATQAKAGERPNCHVYDAKDANPKMPSEFGEFFREGYETATICGAVGGPVEYFVGYRPVKGPTGVCRYRQRQLERELVLGRRLTAEYRQYESSYLWAGDGACPPPGDARYRTVDDVPDDAFLAMMNFWHRLQKKDGDLAEIFVRVPADGEKIRFLNWLRVALDRHAAELSEVGRDRSASGGLSNTADKDGSRYYISVAGPVGGWRISGDVVGGVFVPRVVGFWIA
jgi:hypothetical protein